MVLIVQNYTMRGVDGKDSECEHQVWGVAFWLKLC